MTEKRKGRQLPTQSVVLPYETTKGDEAIALYNKTDRTAQPWQEQLIYDLMTFNDEGLWILDEPVINFTQSIVDDAIKANAEFQY
ncbi:MAG: hypothetical protein PUE18_04630 [Firmicutes bacterium]|nr:hypothetical protein [Bacillota bacterium]